MSPAGFGRKALEALTAGGQDAEAACWENRMPQWVGGEGHGAVDFLATHELGNGG
jgi:hypothetical protein